MTAATTAPLIKVTIDGRETEVPAGTTVFDAARGLGIDIPTLCHAQHQTPVGVCRVCTVEVGGRVLAAACIRPAENNMVVKTDTERVLHSRQMLYELLLADHPIPCTRQAHTGDCELETQATRAGVAAPRFPHRSSPRGVDDSSPIIK